jgi:hypothetical protein
MDQLMKNVYNIHGNQFHFLKKYQHRCNISLQYYEGMLSHEFLRSFRLEENIVCFPFVANTARMFSILPFLVYGRGEWRQIQ